MKPGLIIHETLRQELTAQSLLSDYGQLILNTKKEIFSSNTIFFAIQGYGFSFSFSLMEDELVVERNAYSLVVPLSEIPEFAERNLVFVAWSPGRLTLSCSPSYSTQKPDIFSTGCDIPNMSAPPDLRIFAREKSLENRKSFATVHEFTSRVFDALWLFQSKVNEMHSPSLFWDVTYNGNEIASRAPKHETDIHPAVTLALSDQMLLSGIDMSPDYGTSTGRLDYLFTGAISGEGLAYVAVEFKNYHREWIQGLEKQLPRYMESKGAKYGAYCLLDFQGAWPSEPTMSEEAFMIQCAKSRRRLKAENGLCIKVFKFHLGKRKSASQQG